MRSSRQNNHRRLARLSVSRALPNARGPGPPPRAYRDAETTHGSAAFPKSFSDRKFQRAVAENKILQRSSCRPPIPLTASDIIRLLSPSMNLCSIYKMPVIRCRSYSRCEIWASTSTSTLSTAWNTLGSIQIGASFLLRTLTARFDNGRSPCFPFFEVFLLPCDTFSFPHTE